MKITVAHSPDSDDAFMFYALAHNKIDTKGFAFEHTLQDIQKCNEEALRQTFDVSAISFAAYPTLSENYAILRSGASMGEKAYGPMLAAKEKYPLEALSHLRIAIPGEMTTAALVLKLIASDTLNTKVFPFDRIMEAVRTGEADVGLIIHEGQLTYREAGLKEILNFGTWWWKREKLPLPLGCNVIRKSFPQALQSEVALLLKKSIQYSLEHREEALAYALRFARDLSREKADRFVGMYVNERTLDYGEEGMRAVRRLLSLAASKGFVKKVTPEFVI